MAERSAPKDPHPNNRDKTHTNNAQQLLGSHNNMLLCSAARRHKKSRRKEIKEWGDIFIYSIEQSLAAGRKRLFILAAAFLPSARIRLHLSSRFSPSLYIWSAAAFYALGLLSFALPHAGPCI
jgi:hypothetical protein